MPAYPPSRRDGIVDDYFGTAVPDPYRWLEDGDSPETLAWVEAQKAATEAFLSGVQSRSRIRERLVGLWNYEKYEIPTVRGKLFFHRHNSGVQKHSVLYVSEGADGTPRILLDPLAFSADGSVGLQDWDPSPDGKLLAYALCDSGSDWSTLRIRDVGAGTDYPDRLDGCRPMPPAWLRDGSGFYYLRAHVPVDGAARTDVIGAPGIFFHRAGTAQENDFAVFDAMPDKPNRYLYATPSADGTWLVLLVWEGDTSGNDVYLKDLRDPKSSFLPFIHGIDSGFIYAGNQGDLFFLNTTHGAGRGRLVAVRRDQPDPGAWIELIPEDPSRAVMEEVVYAGERSEDGCFLALWSRHAASAVSLHAPDGRKIHDIELPGLGTVEGFKGQPDGTEIFYSYKSFDCPPAIYRLNARSGVSTLFRGPRLDFPLADYVVERVFYPGKDGTMVPLFIMHRKGIVLDGRNPAILYGYGGFGVSLTPWFWPGYLPWLEMGGIYARANVRGGGEYGEEWHDGGRRENKQNGFDDFIAAAEWLVAGGYTKPERLAIEGGSNGGLLVGACLCQRPDLFGAALPGAGVMDMLRYQNFTVGAAFADEYGTSATPDGFRTLIKYSPLHCVRRGTRYPAVLVSTGDSDDRVVPAHSFKFTAALQSCQSGDAPILLSLIRDMGHIGGRSSQDSLIEAEADKLAFLVKTLGMDD